MSGNVPGRAPGFLVRFICLLSVVLSALAVSVRIEAQENELTDRFYELVESDTGRELLATNIEISIGDEIYVGAGYRYRVTKVEGLTGYCRIVQGLPKGLSFVKLGPDRHRKIGVYYTHGTEGFRDGSNYYGGIVEAGRSAVLGAGINLSAAVVDSSTSREYSYRFSRAQAEKLRRKGCDVLIDIHRDMAPAPVVTLPPRSERASSILIAVGRSHKGWLNNLGFALALKAAADPVYKGLIRGILVTEGKFNQDLSPYALSIVTGDSLHETVWAERAIAAFTSLIPATAFGMPSGPYGAAGTGYAFTAPTDTVNGRNTLGNLIWPISLFVTLIAAVGGYALLLQWGFSDWKLMLKKARDRWEPAFLGRLRKRR